MTHAPLPTTPTDRLASVIDGLCRAVAEAGGRRLLAGPLVILIWSRLRRLAAQVAALAARITAGRQRRVLARRSPRPAPRRPAQRTLPHDHAWLLPLVPQASGYGSQLQHLLADPEFAALVDAAPQMRRLLRPLCRMLGVRLPPALVPPPRPPRPAGPPAAPLAQPPAAACRRTAVGPSTAAPPAGAPHAARPLPPRACGPPVAA